MTAPRLKTIGIAKRFGATRALRGVSFDVGPGEVHALIGENGAGKSTLMKVLSGAHSADEGRIELDGEPFEPRDPLHARRAGIAMIYQELNLAPHLSVGENILLGDEPARFGCLNLAQRRHRARQALIELHHDTIPLTALVGARTIAEQQVVEIARALTGAPKVLIMDEPTSSLTRVDTENLFAVINRLRQRGVSIIYISHFLEECQRICDRYTVLRDGMSVASGDMASADLNDIVHHMVGREINEIYPRTAHEIGETVFEVKNLSGTPKPNRVSFALREGEILGIAGLVGAGRTETLRACFGLDRVEAGEITIFSKVRTDGTPSNRLRLGVGMLSENRKEEGLLLNRSLADNLTITRFEPMTRFGIIRGRLQRRAAAKLMEELDVRARDPLQSVGELSGGNQQKIAVGRLLHHQAKIMLLDEPTRGIDVGSKAQIYALMGELARQGKAVVFVSSYLPELLGVCDTIGVMCRGVLSLVRPTSEWTEHALIAAAIGHNPDGNPATHAFSSSPNNAGV